MYSEYRHALEKCNVKVYIYKGENHASLNMYSAINKGKTFLPTKNIKMKWKNIQSFKTYLIIWKIKDIKY